MCFPNFWPIEVVENDLQEIKKKFPRKLKKPILAERRVSYSTADEESSPRGSNDMIEEQLVTTAPDKKGII